MQQILVTGGAGHLGRLVVKYLSAAGYPVCGMSRRASPGADWPGAAEAVQGMEVVVHLAAVGNSMVDFEGTSRLLEAARQARVSHVVLISVVGIDRVPWAGGKAKLASEDLLERRHSLVHPAGDPVSFCIHLQLGIPPERSVPGRATWRIYHQMSPTLESRRYLL